MELLVAAMALGDSIRELSKKPQQYILYRQLVIRRLVRGKTWQNVLALYAFISW